MGQAVPPAALVGGHQQTGYSDRVRRRPDLLLVMLWACFVARGVFYSALLPLWEGYDEYSHFAYVEHVIAHGTLPVPKVARLSLGVADSLHRVPLPWMLRNRSSDTITHDAFWKLSPLEVRMATRPRVVGSFASLRQEDPEAEGLYESQQPPLYYWILSPFLRMASEWLLPSQVFLLRLVSILICSAAIPFGFAIARRVFSNRGLAAGAVAVAICMPEGLINFARVGNESLSVLVYTVLAWACLQLLDDGPSLRATILIGAALGAGLLTKAYFLTAIPVVCIVFLLAARRSRTTLLHLAGSLAIAAVVAGWWYRFIYQATGDLTGQLQSAGLRAVPWTDRVHAALHLNWLRALDIAALSHVWFGAWSFLQVRSWIYHVFYVVGIAAFAGLALLLLKRREASTIGDRKALGMLALFELAFSASLAYHVTLSQIGYNAPMTCGWYWYCLVFAETTLACAGLTAILPRRARPWAAPSLAGLFAVLDIYGVHLILLPYYIGLVSHTAAGGLPIFRLSQIPAIGLGEISARVMLNRTYLASAGEFWMLWGLYLIATLGCVAVAVRGARNAGGSW